MLLCRSILPFQRVAIPLSQFGTRPALIALAFCAFGPAILGQATGNPNSGPGPGAIPIINIGANAQAAQFATLDFAQIALEQQDRARQKDRERQQALVKAGTVSALDLAAPNKAVMEFNEGMTLLRGQHPQDAMQHLQKAIAVYPRFVSAHNFLGMAYLDADNPAQAKVEFETAIQLDAAFPPSFVNLGKLALSQNNYPSAQAYLEKASRLLPNDAAVLTSLAYAQNGDRRYQDAIATVDRVHGMKHDGMGTAHYVAAIAATSANDYITAKKEFALFLAEDPTNNLAASARYNIGVLEKYDRDLAAANAANAAAQPPPESLANSARLKAALAEAADDSRRLACNNCVANAALADPSAGAASIPRAPSPGDYSGQFTIRKVVDEVAVFFGVSSGGHTVSGLELANIQVRDDSKPPERILQFTPQSKLPLRLGLLIDTSGSVQPRFAFEKKAAAKFLQQMLSNPADLGFVAGFADALDVTQDFTGDHAQLALGAEQLTNAGGTALFDAVSKACWKLSAYPEQQRVARVLVVLTDGEENSSHTSLRQTIRDMEATGVTVYTISTKEDRTVTTDADKVLKMLAESSGGEAFFPGDMPTLSAAFDKLRDEIRSRYLVAYRPADFEPNGKYRAIAITAEKDGKHLKVHARQGYHARAEAATP